MKVSNQTLGSIPSTKEFSNVVWRRSVRSRSILLRVNVKAAECKGGGRFGEFFRNGHRLRGIVIAEFMKFSGKPVVQNGETPRCKLFPGSPASA